MYFDKVLTHGKEIADSLHEVYEALDKPLIAGTGLSGALAISVVNQYYKFPSVIIRKQSDNTHGRKFEDFDYRNTITETDRYIIIDDLLCTGNTIKQIIKDMESFSDAKKYSPKLIFLYQTCACSNLKHFQGTPIGKIPKYCFRHSLLTIENNKFSIERFKKEKVKLP